MSAVDALDFVERRRQTATLASQLTLRDEVVRSRAGVDALSVRWLALEVASDGLNLFQSLGWTRAIFDFEAQRGNADFDPVIVTLHDGQRLVAILPLERIRTGTRRVLTPLGHAFGQYSDVLVARGYDPQSVVRQLLRAATSAAPADTISFYKVRDGSQLALGMPDKNVSTGSEQGAPYVALDEYPDFAAYFATIKAKTRKNMRNARNRLERDGVLEHRVAESEGETLSVVERTLSARADRLKDQGLTSRAFRDGGFIAFCRSLPQRSDVSLLAFSLRHDGQPIAEQWGFVHGGRYYAFVASRDFANSDESPGRLHLGEVIEACAERGIGGCDLGVPAMPYKLTWATQTAPVRDYALPITPRGWLVIQLWDVLLRPALKAMVLRMPAGLRARLMRMAGHGH
jgi:CelD/BcsL family acetyltransferase involved in cellulose biosynthesis